jgi:hypothetical protein
MHNMQFGVGGHSDRRAVARRVVTALTQGETVLCTGYGRVEEVLHAVNALVLAELPTAKSAYLHWPKGERVRLWSLGEFKGVGYFPRQEPARRAV